MIDLEEIWLPVRDYPNYEISSLGFIRRSVDKKILKLRLNTKKYVIVGLRKEGLRKTFLVHRLVALHFIPNPDNKPEVNHKWGIKKDNRATELEWVTRKENESHARDVLGKKSLFANGVVPKKGKDHHMARRALKVSNGVILKEYDYIGQVTEDGFSPVMVAHCCRGERKTHKGFEWKFKTQ